MTPGLGFVKGRRAWWQTLRPRRVRKVLFYYEFLGLGGVETMLLNRLEVLRAMGVDAQVWYSRFWCEGARYLARSGHHQAIERQDVGGRAAAAGFDAIVVIDNPSVASDILDRCPETPTLFETHASYPPRLGEILSVAGDPRLRGIVVPSEYNRRLVLDRTSVSPHRIFIIPNIVNLTLFSGIAAPSPSPNPVVLWVGRLEEPKNPQDLLRVAQLFEHRRSELRFIVIGDAPDYADYVAGLIAVSGRLPSNVTLVRNVAYEQMAGYYRAAARSGGALLSTSHFESAPMILLEAMLLGCPVVSSAVGGIPLMVHDRRTGLLFPPGDVDAAAALVDEVTFDPALRASLVQQARHYIETHHSPASAGRAWRSLFGSSAMGSGPAPAAPER